jgi:Flp pilus assembly protein TadG
MARNSAKAHKVMRRSEAGQTIMLVSFGMITFLAAAGLAVDMGYLRYERRLMQSAADSAALAGATDEYWGSPGNAQGDAATVATQNGFTNGSNNTTVNVTFPGVNLPNPSLALVPGTPVQVTISQILPTFFIQVVGSNSSTITASATATVGSSESCMVALQVGGIGMVVNGPISAGNCGVVDNGPLSGGGSITSPSIGVFGVNSFGGGSSPIAAPMAQPAPDPLAYVQSNPPTPASPCNTLAENLTATSGPAGNGIVTLSPDTYCAIIINGASVTFTSGLYILDPQGYTGQTGLQILGTGNAIGNNVAFYNAPGSGPITFSGMGAINFTASATGLSTLPGGFLFYQDPGNANAADLSQGGATGKVTLSGILYFPNADLTLSGSLTAEDAVVVAQSITINSGGFTLGSDSTNTTLFPQGSPLESVTLVQ